MILRERHIGRDADVGNFNQFTASSDYRAFSPLAGKLLTGETSPSRIAAISTAPGSSSARERVSGNKSALQSSEVDLDDDVTKSAGSLLMRTR